MTMLNDALLSIPRILILIAVLSLWGRVTIPFLVLLLGLALQARLAVHERRLARGVGRIAVADQDHVLDAVLPAQLPGDVLRLPEGEQTFTGGDA